jgi:2'-hydroxyisoflavone reductase
VSTSRRTFIQQSAAGLAIAAASPLKASSLMSRTSRAAGKKILILGGTGFLGPAVVDAAKARGHSLTLFNRGKTEKRIGIIDGVEKLYGNRDPKLHSDEADDKSPMGLDSLKGGKWDAVVDTSGYVPRIVKASAELLAPNVGLYVFISTVSVYAKNDTPGADETAAVGTISDPTVETMGASFENYGPLKALCEQTVEGVMPGRVASVRPGVIVGPGDPTDRFTYWPVRVQRGGEVLAPGSAADLIQLIDVRDLAEFIITLIENKTTGVFNAMGPADLTIGKTLEACRESSKSDATFTWVPADFLEKKNVSAWGDMPAWVPSEGDTAGFGKRSFARATKAGIKLRPIIDTAGATLAWWPKEVQRRTRITQEALAQAEKEGKDAPKMGDPTKLRAGIQPEREKEVLAAWHAEQGPKQDPAPPKTK